MQEVIEIVLDEAEVQTLGSRIQEQMEGMGVKLDADEGNFVARELLYSKAQEINKVYPDLRAREVIPIASDVPEGAESYKYNIFDFRGQSKIVTDYDTHLPTFDVGATEAFGKIVTHAGAIRYGVQEVARAAFARKPLNERKRNAAMWGIRRTENDILFFGSVAQGLVGFVNADGVGGAINAGIPTMNLQADGTGASKNFSTKTSQRIVRDLNAMLRTVRLQSKKTEKADTILLSETAYGVVNTMPFGIDSDKTVLQWFLANNPGVQVDSLLELEDAGVGGVGRAICFTRSPEKVAGQVVVPYRELPPQPDNLHVKIPCYSTCGGVDWLYPLSAVYADGIS